MHRVPLPLPTDGLRAVNVYVLEDGDGLVLIDSGWALAESREALAAALATLGCGLGDVRHFLVTHVHRDHYTQAVELRRIFGSKVSLGAGEHPAIRGDPGQGRPAVRAAAQAAAGERRRGGHRAPAGARLARRAAGRPAGRSRMSGWHPTRRSS